jgi:hypothetical protein
MMRIKANRLCIIMANIFRVLLLSASLWIGRENKKAPPSIAAQRGERGKYCQSSSFIRIILNIIFSEFFFYPHHFKYIFFYLQHDADKSK